MAQAWSVRAPPKPAKRKVAFDSSFLLAVMERPTPWKEDITERLGAFSPVVLASVRAELERLSVNADKRARFASLALELVDGVFAIEQDGRGSPDDEIVSFALRERAAVATIDSELAKRLRASHVTPVITLRSGRVAM